MVLSAVAIAFAALFVAFVGLAYAGVMNPFTPLAFLTGGLGSSYADWIDPAFQTRLEPPAGTALDGALYLARQK